MNDFSKIAICLSVGLVCPFALACGWIGEALSWKEVDSTIQSVFQSALEKKEKLVSNQLLFSTGSEQEAFEDAFEKLTFLEKETLELQLAIQESSIPPSAAAQKRLQFLQSGKNAVHFLRSSPAKGTSFQETTLQLETPIEVNEHDLKRVLSLLEGKFLPEGHKNAERGSQILVTQFHLEKLPASSHLFSLSLTLTKREPLP